MSKANFSVTSSELNPNAENKKAFIKLARAIVEVIEIFCIVKEEKKSYCLVKVLFKKNIPIILSE